MRKLAVSLRSLIITVLRAIDVEGFLILGGIGILAWLVRDAYVLAELTPPADPGISLGALVIVTTMIVTGIAFARAPKV